LPYAFRCERLRQLRLNASSSFDKPPGYDNGLPVRTAEQREQISSRNEGTIQLPQNIHRGSLHLPAWDLDLFNQRFRWNGFAIHPKHNRQGATP
jgi:hypothetical protein